MTSGTKSTSTKSDSRFKDDLEGLRYIFDTHGKHVATACLIIEGDKEAGYRGDFIFLNPGDTQRNGKVFKDYEEILKQRYPDLVAFKMYLERVGGNLNPQSREFKNILAVACMACPSIFDERRGIYRETHKYLNRTKVPISGEQDVKVFANVRGSDPSDIVADHAPYIGTRYMAHQPVNHS